jgi:hypothetical protein
MLWNLVFSGSIFFPASPAYHLLRDGYAFASGSFLYASTLQLFRGQYIHEILKCIPFKCLENCLIQILLQNARAHLGALFCADYPLYDLD